jgi:selT/selW/selH-like putative selenoprotein
LAAHLKERYGAEVEMEKGHSGVYDVSVDGTLIFSKHSLSRFPEEGEIDELIAERLG